GRLFCNYENAFEKRPSAAKRKGQGMRDIGPVDRGLALAPALQMRSPSIRARLTLSAVACASAVAVVLAAPTLGGPLPGPLPPFPSNNWWNLDIPTWPVDPGWAGFITFVGATRGLHPDFGGDVSPGSTQIYGFPYLVVDGTQTKRAVTFQYADESDGVNHTTG